MRKRDYFSSFSLITLLLLILFLSPVPVCITYFLFLGYKGENCQTDIDECAGNPCGRNGYCSDGINGYRCTCVKGFGGRNCETNLDDCTSNPCYNGGTCHDSFNSFTCDCPLGFAGSRCEINIDDCAGNLCRHGTCVDGINDFTCRCEPGYAGRLCDRKIDVCEFNPCMHGGTCEETATGFTVIFIRLFNYRYYKYEFKGIVSRDGLSTEAFGVYFRSKQSAVYLSYT
jgi:hypothetical protein